MLDHIDIIFSLLEGPKTIGQMDGSNVRIDPLYPPLMVVLKCSTILSTPITRVSVLLFIYQLRSNARLTKCISYVARQ